MDVQVDSAEMELRGTFPVAGKYGVGDDDAAAFEEIDYTLDIKSPAPAERVRGLVEKSERFCHAAQSLRNPVPVVSLVRLNDQDLAI